MGSDLEITAEEAYARVEEAFRKEAIEFTRESGLVYKILNFGHFYARAVAIADSSLRETPFYAQEVPYREEKVEGRPDTYPSELLVLHRDESK
tara:strand:+ start:1317 stop:1595 length:279 start_codon:yes stop_codon:yes gene_type:complete